VILVIFAKQPNRTIGEKPPKASTPLPELQGDSLAIETVTPHIVSIELRPNDLASSRILASD
jgi:hypothetical protein